MSVISLIILSFGGFTFGVPLENRNFERIIGGVDAPEGHAPHMVALIYGHVFKLMMCGGSIIRRNVILTAAGCINPGGQNEDLPYTFHGRIGSNQWNSGGVIVQFKTYRTHPLWDPQNIRYDAGVIITKNNMLINKGIRAIALGHDWVGGQQKAWVTGWGVTAPTEGEVVNLAPIPDNLQLLHIETLASQRCNKDMRKVAAELGWATVPPIDDRVQICTFHSVGRGMCNGDGGSALVRAKDGKQVGIVSWGLPCAIGAPDVFTRITAVQDFVDEAISKLS